LPLQRLSVGNKRLNRLGRIKPGTFIVIGAVIGLAIGIVVSVITDLPLMPEAGTIAGGLIALYLRRDELRRSR
jgi:phosphatidylserine decarboxylase